MESLHYDLHQVPKIKEWYKNLAHSELLSKELEDYRAFIKSAFGDKLPKVPQEDVFVFYYAPLSCPSQAVKCILDIVGGKYTTQIINLFKGDHQKL